MPTPEHTNGPTIEEIEAKLQGTTHMSLEPPPPPTQQDIEREIDEVEKRAAYAAHLAVEKGNRIREALDLTHKIYLGLKDQGARDEIVGPLTLAAMTAYWEAQRIDAIAQVGENELQAVERIREITSALEHKIGDIVEAKLSSMVDEEVNKTEDIT